MNLNVKYFGEIAEILDKDNESLEIGANSSLNDFSELIETLYPQLQGYVFKIAVNLTLDERNVFLNDNDEIALLPPFAGG